MRLRLVSAPDAIHDSYGLARWTDLRMGHLHALELIPGRSEYH